MTDFQKLMETSLREQLKKRETLRAPVYGALIQQKGSFYGFFGLTEDTLLMALMDPTQKKINWTSRTPLELTGVEVKKNRLLGQYLVTLHFAEGKPCILRLYKKLLTGNLQKQAQNVEEFLSILQNYKSEKSEAES